MKLVCSQADLNASLQLVGRAVSNRPTHPILATVLLTADAATGRLRLTGFDGNLGIQTSFQAAVDKSSAIALPARLFSEIVSRLASGTPITLRSADISEQVELTSLSGSYQLMSQPAADFPDLPLMQRGSPIRIDADTLVRGLRGTVFASSTDETKAQLQGVHIRLDQTGLECAATDGHRLAVLHSPATGDALDITIPAKSVRELERLIASQSCAEPLSLFYSAGRMVVLHGDHVLTSRVLDGTYPKYEQLIPKGFKHDINIDRRQFITALERVSVLADTSNNVVKLEIKSDHGEVIIRADAKDSGRGSESVAATITGEELQIAFNVHYLLDGLKAMSAKYVVLRCVSPIAPAIAQPDDKDERFTYLVMPIQVR